MRSSTWIIVGAVAVVLFFGGATVALARGLRNNNPGNIRRTANDSWLGMAPAQTDPQFVQFVSPEYGIRAIAVTLRTYRTRYGLRTIEQMLMRWAPPTENDTEAYIAHVASAVGIDPRDVVTDSDIPEIVAALISHENGVNPYSLATIERGVSLA